MTTSVSAASSFSADEALPGKPTRASVVAPAPPSPPRSGAKAPSVVRSRPIRLPLSSMAVGGDNEQKVTGTVPQEELLHSSPSVLPKVGGAQPRSLPSISRLPPTLFSSTSPPSPPPPRLPPPLSSSPPPRLSADLPPPPTPSEAARSVPGCCCFPGSLRASCSASSLSSSDAVKHAQR